MGPKIANFHMPRIWLRTEKLGYLGEAKEFSA